MTARERRLDWEGCVNARDLGGLKTRQGHVTRWGAVVRSDHPSKLTDAGWSALYAHGIRTIISLYTEGQDEKLPAIAPHAPDIELLRVAVEDVGDQEFLNRWATTELWCTPLYYRDALARWPERHPAALTLMARAKPGGVLIHCARGHDRTGIVSMLLLAFAGVEPEEILADYQLSVDPEREEILARAHTSTREVILSSLSELDAEAYLRQGGMRQEDLEAIRARFLKPIVGQT